jgi:hypothetical protein
MVLFGPVLVTNKTGQEWTKQPKLDTLCQQALFSALALARCDHKGKNIRVMTMIFFYLD